jgi:hypothetical protein
MGSTSSAPGGVRAPRDGAIIGRARSRVLMVSDYEFLIPSSMLGGLDFGFFKSFVNNSKKTLFLINGLNIKFKKFLLFR